MPIKLCKYKKQRVLGITKYKRLHVDAKCSSKCARCNRSATNGNTEEPFDPGEGPSQPRPQEER